MEDVTSDWHWVIAPTKFLGNWGSYLSVSADILGDSQGVLYPAEFSISGGGNTATHSFLLGDVVAGDWRTLSVNLEAPLWNVSGDWSTLTANVSEFKIRMDYNNYFRLMGTSEVDGLDNVRLAVPEPATSWLLCSGLIGLLPMGLKKRKKT